MIIVIPRGRLRAGLAWRKGLNDEWVGWVGTLGVARILVLKVGVGNK